jgi:hypothetical protein
VTIEAMLMERAAGGAVFQRGGTPVPDARAMDPELALNLVRLRRAPPGLKTNLGGPAPRRASIEELEAAILAKLDVLAQRKQKERRRRAAGKGSGSGRSAAASKELPREEKASGLRRDDR